MGCATGENRKKQKATAKEHSSSDSSEDELKPCEKVVAPRLISLRVERAIEVDDTHFWEAVSAVEKIRVIAETEPADAIANWIPDDLEAGENGNVKLVSRAARGTTTVTASLDVKRSVEIKIYDLTDMTSTLPADGAAGHRWKAYDSLGTTVLTAVTAPDTNEVWPLVDWPEGVRQDPANGQAVDLTPVGDRKVTASLGRIAPKTVDGVLHICKWPVLRVQEVKFRGYTVDKDTDGNWNKKWVRGRAANRQSPICYARKQHIQLSATFKVMKHPTDTETVQVRGRATLGTSVLEWASTGGHVSVTNGAGTVDLVLTTSDNPVPDSVGCYDPMVIDWEMTKADGTWVAIGSSSNVLYATLGAPSGTPAYWTLLDVSCRAAHGATDADALVAGFYPEFAGHTGTGRGIQRKRDNVRLSYWLLAYDNAEVFTTAELLASANGSGRCGSWARFLMDMCKVHGVMTALPYNVITAENPSPECFLVKNHQFIGAGSHPQPLPYEGEVECVKQNGAAGQGWDNPLALFADHGMVEYGGEIYDPSYGSGPFATHKLWEDASLDGLGGGGPGGLTLYAYAGIRHLMANRCSPGFRTHTVAGVETMDSIAVTYSVASGNALFNHAINAALRGKRATSADVMAGDTVYIPRAISNVSILVRV